MPEASQDAYRSNVRPEAAQAEERVSRGLQSLGGKRHQVNRNSNSSQTGAERQRGGRRGEFRELGVLQWEKAGPWHFHNR